MGLSLALGLSTHFYRFFAAFALACSLIGVSAAAPQPAYAYNCVDVVMRDPYWGQFRRIVESGWNAAGVGGAFARNGFAVDNSPEVGDIMVWPVNYFGASYTGHVAVVSAVYANGTVLVRHENWPFGSAEHAQVFTVHLGNQFVHQPGAVAVAEADNGEAAA
jgi:surface antigen